ncbi:MAG: glycoside hydrolase family 78 protein [Clostridia bacterium]|nr:glycoside hydrolase family 78 protein [Clostridia bacterium]
MLRVYDINVNGVNNPFYVPTKNLRFSWKLYSDNKGVFQKSYRFFLKENQNVLFDSDIVLSDNCVDIPVDISLPSNKVICFFVEITDNFGETATSSISFCTSLKEEDIIAKWIKPKNHIEGWAPYLRTKFSTYDCEIKRATLLVSGLGCGEYYINNKKISDDLIDPPMTNYEKEIFYRMINVKNFLEKDNAFCALLGDGWYSQSRFEIGECKYGDVCIFMQLIIEYTDGKTQTIISDDKNWKYKYSPIVLNNLYGGETYDARLETPDFADALGSEDGWDNVVIDNSLKGKLTLCQMPAVKVIRKIPAISVKSVSGKNDGAWIIDMGENFAGIAEFHIKKSAVGAQYVFRFAETINPDGTLDFRSTGSFATRCIQQDIYIAKGIDGEVYRPRFTYHSFRYIEVTGYCDLKSYGLSPELDFAVGLATSTDFLSAGNFTCSNEDINSLQKIILSTFRSNYHGFPEDCPGREKCGWLGDAQIVCNTGIYNFSLQSCYEKYLDDIRTEKEVYGTWKMIAPGKRTCGDASPLWGSAQVLIPYYLYLYYGDKSAVIKNSDLMEEWIDHELKISKDYLIEKGLGDWCPPCGNKNQLPRIPVIESSTQTFYEVCAIMSNLCEKLNLPNKKKYDDLKEKIKASIIKHFWNQKLHSYSSCGSNAVALALGLYPEGEKENLFNTLIKMIKKNGYAMTTGIYGNKYLLPLLCENKKGDIALKIMFNTRHTSFKTILNQGATSLFEVLTDKLIGQPKDKGTSSFNHPMHSGFAYMFYSCIAGIKPISAGFKEFIISPCHFEKMNFVKATHICPYGEIALSYKKEKDKTEYTFTIPANTKARFIVNDFNKEYTSGTYTVIL